MPAKVTYPGIYVEELPSNHHNVTPLATNIAAFIGRTMCGPVDEPKTVYSYEEFKRQFGGLQFDYPLSYALQDFFNNGGSQAVIARLFEPSTSDGYARLHFPDDHSSLTLKASNPGLWGNELTAKVDMEGITDTTAAQFTDDYALKNGELFNITLTLYNAKGQIIASERYLNVSVSLEDIKKDFPNRLDKVLAAESMLANVEHLSAKPPSDGQSAKGAGGDDGIYLKPSTYIGSKTERTGLYLLDKTDVFNLLCTPPDRRMLPELPEDEWDLDPGVRSAAAQYATEKRAFYIVDPISSWSEKVRKGQIIDLDTEQLSIIGQGPSGEDYTTNCAVYFPRIIKEDPHMENRDALFSACGAIAGVMASTDASQGVWKAPAGQSASIAGISKLEIGLNDTDNAILNPKGINCLRSFPVIGPVIWGARTLRGADIFSNDYKYIPVRRLTLFIEESLNRGTRWAIFEPNNETLWFTLKQEIGSFLSDLTKEGALYDYSVQCDASNNPPSTIANGIVTITIGIAPIDPAEFIFLQIQQSKPTG